jgi:hypothetical protein
MDAFNFSDHEGREKILVTHSYWDGGRKGERNRGGREEGRCSGSFM